MTTNLLNPIQALPASVEILPRQVPGLDELRDMLPAGTRVYLGDIGSDGVEDEMLIASRRLRDAGCFSVPHLAARRIRSFEALERRIGRLVEEGGVNDVLVVGGGLPAPAGPFASSLQLLETGVLDRFGISDVAIAGHPEGSPDFSDAVAFDALRQKKEFAERTAARLRIVTQFGFDASKALRWADALREAGLNIPIHIGVAGPAKISTLIKYGRLCGVGNSLSMLTRHSGSLLTLATGYSPDTFVVPIERQVQDRPSLVSQIHVFPFGGLNSAATWLRKRGSWRVSAELLRAAR